MPAIASLEDLKAVQKEGLSIYAMFTRRSLGVGGLYALCLPAAGMALCVSKEKPMPALWFFTDTYHGHGHGFNEERTPEELKGEGG